MNRKFNLDSNANTLDQKREISNLLKYWKSEGVVVETKKGFYRLKTQKEIRKEIADICK